MKRKDWLVPSILILLGIHCLVMSGIVSSTTSNSYLNLLIQICIWMSVPLLIGTLIYIILKIVNRKSKSRDFY
ncbi:hypothetical protein DH09_00180 (plasmid) [Bacillaceae bacterium JMAK1]|uniref:Uncharacterized protein n=1 Tax=Geomicrobium sediminis TaxID=1347788 RepID=A0ABS2PFI1_9BACL|nr:hypothetical protein DH09_00180 [Bacillaceae bacterium JMAK1]MBM7634179.1 hypothetical protein [Geomicrobium sediminis]